MKQTLIYPELSYELTGVFFKVHNELGRYCNEKQYGDSLEKELIERKIRFEREKILEMSFEGEKKGRNKIDFLIEDKIIVEIKCVRTLSREAYYQLRRYLMASNKKLGILVNFRDNYLRPRRVLNPNGRE